MIPARFHRAALDEVEAEWVRDKPAKLAGRVAAGLHALRDVQVERTLIGGVDGLTEREAV